MEYKEEYAKMLIDHMSKGLSFESFGAVVNVTVDELHSWKKLLPEFNKAEGIGHLHRQLIWEKMGLLGAQGHPGFDRKAWESLKPPARIKKRAYGNNS